MYNRSAAPVGAEGVVAEHCAIGWSGHPAREHDMQASTAVGQRKQPYGLGIDRHSAIHEPGFYQSCTNRPRARRSVPAANSLATDRVIAAELRIRNLSLILKRRRRKLDSK